ncbi:metallophosphoesterase family protein [Pedobacter metabolipauper]|uniref:metallophosphoesterase family protein n=1 Tax=Pedobacter metabolipauper TaxID=425513 RepID=UPI001FB63E6B|nr:metallophosphoesterase [Pedobacter metabolipauper]
MFNQNSLKDLNAAALKKLTAATPKNDTIKVVLAGDTQRSYNEIPGLVKKVNSIDNLDLVLVAGDISEFGTLQEMDWYAKRLLEVNVPVITVIGNHDLVARGNEVYQRMFGELNFSFVYRGIKFVCHDTNSREYNFNGKVPDMEWLSKEMQPQQGVNGFIAVSHVPPFSLDFDQKLIDPYTKLFSQTDHFLASLHGHTHVYSAGPYKNSAFPYLVTGSAETSEFILVKIINDQLTYERIFY